VTDSLDPGPREADLDAPRRHLGVFFFADEVELGYPDVSVAGELPHLVHRRPVADRVVDRRLAQRVNTDAAAAQPRRVDPGRLAIVLDQLAHLYTMSLGAPKYIARQRAPGVPIPGRFHVWYNHTWPIVV